ncbi:Uncharacterized protein FKW44_003854, partial [Caligus rogercresseyi]
RAYSLSSGSPFACLTNPGHFGTHARPNVSHPYDISVRLDPTNTTNFIIKVSSHEDVGFKGILIEPRRTNKGGFLKGHWVEYDGSLFKEIGEEENCGAGALTHKSRKIKNENEFVYSIENIKDEESVVFKNGDFKKLHGLLV